MDFILGIGIILVIGALSCKLSIKAGSPVLLGFILIGMLIGNWFEFESMTLVEHLCDFGLLLIIFTGGFQTNFQQARPVLTLSSVLSVAGTLLTTAFSFAFAYFVLSMEFYQALLLGAIISATDAASVFSILQSRKLELKSNLDSVLEIESGSNDPLGHMLALFLILLAKGELSSVPVFFILEICVGVLSGILIARIGQWLINKLNVDIDGLYAVLLCGTAFLIYGAAAQFGGSGFLAVYIGGIILGNSKLVYKRFLSRMFSAIYMCMQIMLFIVLGILTVPASIAKVAVSGLIFAAFLILVARPVVVYILMKPFSRPLNEIALVAWGGFRGAPSIVFATHLLISGLPYGEYVFSMVFFVCILSVVIQGSSFAHIAKKLKLVDE